MQRSAINLNVFTNVASDDPRHCLVPVAIRSFFACFARPEVGLEVVVRIFIDPNPHRDHFADWTGVIADQLRDVDYQLIQTKGLSDGFRRSIAMSEGEYAIQLEHDWIFLKHRIKHTLPQIIEDMRARRINYLRFNKRRNVQFGTDYFVDEDDSGSVPLCRINGRSNNPQIIDVAYYQALVANYPHIGLEGHICRYAGGGYLYGPTGWPRTVQHLDGRRVRAKDNIARLLYMLRTKGIDYLRPSKVPVRPGNANQPHAN